MWSGNDIYTSSYNNSVILKETSDGNMYFISCLLGDYHFVKQDVCLLCEHHEIWIFNKK